MLTSSTFYRSNTSYSIEENTACFVEEKGIYSTEYHARVYKSEIKCYTQIKLELNMDLQTKFGREKFVHHTHHRIDTPCEETSCLCFYLTKLYL